MKKVSPLVDTDHQLLKKVKKQVFKKKSSLLEPEDIHKSLDIVDAILHDARDFKLETEVVTWALKYMKRNPNLTISDAITLAYEEWVK
jgi:hypothetical protein